MVSLRRLEFLLLRFPKSVHGHRLLLRKCLLFPNSPNDGTHGTHPQFHFRLKCLELLLRFELILLEIRDNDITAIVSLHQ